MTDTHDPLARHKQLTRDLMAHAVVASDDPLERASALIAAATVIVELEVGTAAAPAALMALVEPSLAGWQAALRE